MLAELLDKDWDFIVVGTGIGGGLTGRRLAEQGFSVLFVERGGAGFRSEQHSINANIVDQTARTIRGYWPHPLHVEVDGKEHVVLNTIGSGVGGTSVFYAAQLERPERHDFEGTEERPHPTGGWPVSHSEFDPYYAKAEELLHVCGEPNELSDWAPVSLREPPKMAECDAWLMDAFRRNGLHPYRVHIGIKYLPGCQECMGRKCPRHCKMDGRSAGVEPALATGNAALLDNCHVKALRGGSDHVTCLEAEYGGQIIELKAKRYIVAGGGIGTPRLLLSSASQAWPAGCGNSSGLVGKNLMCHLDEFIAVWPQKNLQHDGPSKAIALRDMYFHEGDRYGLFQSLGMSASYGNILHFLNTRFEQSAFAKFEFLRDFLRVPALVAASVFGEARVFTGLLEDLPYEHNRVQLQDDDPNRLQITYTLAPELKQRRKSYRRLIKNSLGNLRSYYLHTEPQLNFGHSCGTARFGVNPAESVLDANCRVHEIDNLYVVDGSFMPTSAGVNPSLTIAANALRVADILCHTRPAV